jgi:hypothetical protein
MLSNNIRKTRTFKCDVMWLLNGDSSYLDGDSSLNPPKCDVAFKITNRLKFNKDYLKFNSDFKRHIKLRRTLVLLISLLLD